MDLYWEDSTNAQGLQPGMYGYAGYFNGPFANLSSIRSRFPGHPVMGYATRISGSHGADAIDCEPGTLGSTFAANAAGALTFVKAWTGGGGIFARPIVYTMATWMRQMEDYLTSNGIARSAYFMNSAHANGTPHYCSPAHCGFGRTEADMTQYLFAGGFDRTIGKQTMLRLAPAPPPPANPYPLLHVGSTGKPVTSLRVHLDAWGAHLARDADGGPDVFGAIVEAAVKKFQHDHHLTVTGTTDPATWKAVLTAPPAGAGPAPVPPSPKPPVMPTIVLRAGSTGAEVRILQTRLTGSGIPGVRGITVDGTFGSQTDTAVRNLQHVKGLTVDGVVGPKTWAVVWTL